MNLFKHDDEEQPVAKPAADEVYLNPELNFWENRTTHRHAELPAGSLEAQAMPDAPAAAPLVQTLTPPDASHTLLNRGKWVRPWGLRNFGYSLLAFIGVQLLVSVVLFFVVIMQATATMSPQDLVTNDQELTKRLTALLQVPVVLILAQFSMYVVWLGYMWWSTRYRGARSWAKDFGLWFKKRDILIGIGSAAALLALETGVTNLIQAIAPKADYSGMDNGAIFSNQSGLAFIVVGIGLAGIIGPICEELYFRGFFLTAIQRWFGRYAPRLGGLWVSVIAIAISSIFFGSVHFQGIDTFGQILVVFFTGGIGVVLAIFRVVFKRLGPGIVTHMAFNTASLLLAYYAIGGN